MGQGVWRAEGGLRGRGAGGDDHVPPPLSVSEQLEQLRAQGLTSLDDC